MPFLVVIEFMELFNGFTMATSNIRITNFKREPKKSRNNSTLIYFGIVADDPYCCGKLQRHILMKIRENPVGMIACLGASYLLLRF